MSNVSPGQCLGGRYELHELAGTGGMAQVYRAVTLGAEGFRRPVAVKRILDHLGSSTEFVSMFVEEARVTAALSHPNIAQIHDFGRDERGAYFLVLEWVEGVTLLQWATAFQTLGERTPWPIAAAIAIEVLKGLGAAHENKDRYGTKSPVFHRDVTPQNILIGTNGVVKLTDFGLARATDRARMTRPEIVKGKVSYLAPELLEPGAEPSAQSDMFSLGVVMHHILSGRKLFAGDNPIDVLQQIKEGRVARIDLLRPDLPQALVDTIHRALASDPSMRFSSARRMVRALANILRLTPESTSADSISRTVDEARRTLGIR